MRRNKKAPQNRKYATSLPNYQLTTKGLSNDWHSAAGCQRNKPSGGQDYQEDGAAASRDHQKAHHNGTTYPASRQLQCRVRNALDDPTCKEEQRSASQQPVSRSQRGAKPQAANPAKAPA